MSVKSIIQIIILVVSILPNIYYLWGGFEWLTSGADKSNVETARGHLVASLIVLVPLAGISILVFFLVPPIDILSIALLVLTNFCFILSITLFPLSSLVGGLVSYLRKYISGRLQLARKRKNNKFDIVLFSNEEDKADVIQLADQLQKEGILPWFDVREVQPGQSWKSVFTQEFLEIKAAAACVGRKGTGPWQRQEIEALLREFVVEGRPVIPILLPSAPQKPLLPLFLGRVIWIDLREIKQWKDFRSERYYSMRLLLNEIERRGIYKLQPLSSSEQAKREIREALANRDYRQYAELSQAIILLMEATDPTPIEAEGFQPGTLWEIVLPSLGLQLETEKALFFLRREKPNPSQCEQLVEIKNARGASLILVVDFLEGLGPRDAQRDA